MKALFRTVAVAFATLLIMAGATACGESQADKAKKLEAAAAALDSVFNPAQAPVAALSITADGTDINFKATLSDSLIHADLLGEELVNYFVANQIKHVKGAVINQVNKALDSTLGSLKLSITDTWGNNFAIAFSSENLRHLYKAKGSQLNVPTVKEQVVALLGNSLPASMANKDAQSITLTISKGFLNYNVQFDKYAKYKKGKQGHLTTLYFAPLKVQYANLGVLQTPIIDTLKELGIDGIRVTFSAQDSDKELKQAFPWREIVK